MQFLRRATSPPPPTTDSGPAVDARVRLWVLWVSGPMLSFMTQGRSEAPVAQCPFMHDEGVREPFSQVVTVIDELLFAFLIHLEPIWHTYTHIYGGH